mmetsp:Transcript_56701/g.88236  ORF Transcript_56701/g.88236 Transcript_56701/m.88236 type:complete len:181 (+) Transcript_56701:65-607(+)
MSHNATSGKKGKGVGKGKSATASAGAYATNVNMPYPWVQQGSGFPVQSSMGQAQPLTFEPADLLGSWADSLGNAVHVFSSDAYEMRLSATLSRPPRPDIHLALRQCNLGGGWQCGNSVLDPVWTSDKQLHWVTVDGRVSVWVRLHDSDLPTEPKDTQESAKTTSTDVQAQPQEGTEAPAP